MDSCCDDRSSEVRFLMMRAPLEYLQAKNRTCARVWYVRYAVASSLPSPLLCGKTPSV